MKGFIAVVLVTCFFIALIPVPLSPFPQLILAPRSGASPCWNQRDIFSSDTERSISGSGLHLLSCFSVFSSPSDLLSSLQIDTVIL